MTTKSSPLGQRPESSGPDIHDILSQNGSELPGPAILKPTSRNIFLRFFYLVILAVAIAIKLFYHTIDATRFFRDTASYAANADLPFTSLSFWAGIRPFTLPLFFKILGVSSLNYKIPAIMERVAWAQSVFSILCWAVLGLTISRWIRNRWLGAVVFGLVLAFSLMYEISRWDLLVLSESLAFSFFALLLAGWIWLLGMPSSWHKSLRGYLVLACVIGVTVLYSFTRDPNPYFILMCAVLFAAASFIRRTGLPRVYTLIYLAVAILLFFAQNASSDAGNRWQIFIYDHFALRFTDTPEFVDYFKRAGLPVSQGLYKPLSMRGSVYEDMLLNDPAYVPVRQWTKAHGKATYLGYLLSYPKMTLSLPLIDATQVLNGTSEDVLYRSYADTYRAPLQEGQFLPRWLRVLTKVLFPTFSAWVYGVIYLVLVSLAGWALVRGWDPVSWLLLAVLLITMYPQMILVYFGDPLELGRHALQIAVSFRLAGWLVLALGADRLIYSRLKKLGGSSAFSVSLE